ncbi:SRPBCC family protein [Phaeobacter sp.]|uniref:SRPBCC family protein n=1 Tax=Phaeobacter sp. TaxID=1902409 RepID=UPI0025F7F7AC|nr:SRPBCC family protein [Phaeobacter sp.]
MQFSGKEDINAPIADVFRTLCDFELLERLALRRGVDLQRMGDVRHPESGLAWEVGFSYRGKQRKLHMSIAEHQPVTNLLVKVIGSGMDGDMAVELLALAPQRTRMQVVLDVRAKTLTGRLMLQSFKLAKVKLNEGFDRRLGEFARFAEERFTDNA